MDKGPPARGAERAKVLGQEPAVTGRAAGAECDWPKPGTGRKWGPCRPESRPSSSSEDAGPPTSSRPHEVSVSVPLDRFRN